jgi:hypothetical protein
MEPPGERRNSGQGRAGAAERDTDHDRPPAVTPAARSLVLLRSRTDRAGAAMRVPVTGIDDGAADQMLDCVADRFAGRAARSTC